MAYLILPRIEACAVNFLSVSSSRDKADAALTVSIKAIRSVDLISRGWMPEMFTEGNQDQLCPILDPNVVNFEDVRSKLPSMYRLDDDGVLWQAYGSTVENHFSLDHGKERDALGYSFDSSDHPSYHIVPYDGADYERRHKLISKREAYTETTSRLDIRARHVSTPTVRLLIPNDFDVAIENYDKDGLGFSMWSLEIGYSLAYSSCGLWRALSKKPEATSIGDLFAMAVYAQRTDRPYNIGSMSSKTFLSQGQKFASKFIVPEDVQKKVVEEKKANGIAVGRRVSLDFGDTPEDVFTPEYFVNTRCNSLQGTSFLRLGTRVGEEKKVFLQEPKERHDFLTPLNSVLIHKSEDAWRFVFLFAAYYINSSIESSHLNTIPCYYMIPQYVHRNEVTFSDLSFRGLSVSTQKAIWGVPGLSVAIQRAMMGLAYQVTLIPKHFALDETALGQVPIHHKVALTGKGFARQLPADVSVTKHVIEDTPYLDLDGYWPLNFNSRSKAPLTRAADILDNIFYPLPNNMLKPGKPKATKVVTTRNVRV